jgi:hypothetical protein
MRNVHDKMKQLDLVGGENEKVFRGDMERDFSFRIYMTPLLQLLTFLMEPDRQLGDIRKV